MRSPLPLRSDYGRLFHRRPDRSHAQRHSGPLNLNVRKEW